MANDPMALTPEVINAVLAKQGMPNTTENLNRIAQFAAINPDMLAQYLGQGTDARATGDAINRSIASTDDPRLAKLAGPNPYKVTLDPNTGLTNVGPGLVNTPEPSGRVIVGQPRRATQGRSGASAATEPDVPPQGAGQPRGGAPSGPRWSGYEVEPDTSSQGAGGSLDQWLLPILIGPAAAAAYMARNKPGATAEPQLPPRFNPTPEAQYVGPMPRGSGVQGSNVTGQLEAPRAAVSGPNAQGRIEPPPTQLDNRAPSTTRNSPELEQAGKDRAARDAKVAADVAAENERQRHLMEQIRARQAAQESTEALSQAARNVLNRRK